MASIKEVLQVVNDTDWQDFRVSLKGIDTEDKIRKLHHRYVVKKAASNRAEYVRIDNYIKALTRGGQLHPGESLDSVVASGWKPRIRKVR